jgi:N-methylhydantoinase A
VLPEYREYERTATTVVNAYVAPLMMHYLARLERESGARPLRIMGSAGGAVPIAIARREPVHTVLSGPAGGVAGALAVARTNGIDNIISFDMGGTSTDVSLCPGGPLFTREFTIGGTPVAVPVLDIHTVGAGGGSIAWVDAGGLLRVGPRSAGAVPGPICYGRGGTEVTVTDAHVWLGRLPANAFLGGHQLLDRAAIGSRLAALARQLGMTSEDAAAGIITIANTTMEGALRVISVERGYDPVDFTLVAFGGAAGLHAAELAERLGTPRILLPLHPGVLSAFGMLAAPVRKSAARTVLVRSDVEPEQRLDTAFSELEAGARAAMLAEGIADPDIAVARSIDARYQGQSHELRIDAHEWVSAFHIAHARRYGYANENAVVEAVTVRVDATSPPSVLPPYADPTATHGVSGTCEVWCQGSWRKAQVLSRAALGQDVVIGPAILTEYSSTTWVPDGWQLRLLASGALLLGRIK